MKGVSTDDNVQVALMLDGAIIELERRSSANIFSRNGQIQGYFGQQSRSHTAIPYLFQAFTLTMSKFGTLVMGPAGAGKVCATAA